VRRDSPFTPVVIRTSSDTIWTYRKKSMALAAARTAVANNVKTVMNLRQHDTVASIRAVRKSLQPSIKVGFVPTMGALHEGRSVGLL